MSMAYPQISYFFLRANSNLVAPKGPPDGAFDDKTLVEALDPNHGRIGQDSRAIPEVEEEKAAVEAKLVAVQGKTMSVADLAPVIAPETFTPGVCVNW